VAPRIRCCVSPNLREKSSLNIEINLWKPTSHPPQPPKIQQLPLGP
jgi:hypothetical protein